MATQHPANGLSLRFCTFGSVVGVIGVVEADDDDAGLFTFAFGVAALLKLFTPRPPPPDFAPPPILLLLPGPRTGSELVLLRTAA